LEEHLVYSTGLRLLSENVVDPQVIAEAREGSIRNLPVTEIKEAWGKATFQIGKRRFGWLIRP
jgi:hypothetical protein